MKVCFAFTVQTRRGRRFYVRHSRGGCQTAWCVGGARIWSHSAGMNRAFDRCKAEGRNPVVHLVTSAAVAAFKIEEKA